MKKIILLFLTLAFLSCSENKDSLKIDIKGNWSFIDLDSEYYEVLVDSNSMLFYDESVGFLQKRNYKLKGDSLFIYLPEKLNSAKPYMFNYIDNEVFLLDIKNVIDTLVRMKRIDTSEFTFDKMKDFQNENEELKFSVAYNNRRNVLLKIDTIYHLDSILKERKNIEPPEIIKLKKYEPNDGKP